MARPPSGALLYEALHVIEPKEAGATLRPGVCEFSCASEEPHGGGSDSEAPRNVSCRKKFVHAAMIHAACGRSKGQKMTRCP